MLRRVTRALLLSFVVFAALSATSAFAAAPQASPVLLKNYTFETAAAADQGDFYSFNAYRGQALGSYWWGRSAGHGHSGYGLWCAASGTPAVAYGSVPTAYTTAGEADFAVTDTTGWYKSDLSFWYKFPGNLNPDGFTDPLSVSWFNSGNTARTGVSDSSILSAAPISSSWTQVVKNRTGAQRMSGHGRHRQVRLPRPFRPWRRRRWRDHR